MKKLILLSAMLFASIGLMFGQMAVNHGQGYQGGQIHHQGYNNHGPPVASEADFRMVMQQVQYQRYEDSKLRVAKQSVRDYAFSSRHVAQLMLELRYENNKLGLAKHAYRFVVDPHNYHLVNRSFQFHASTRDLNNWIARNGNQGQFQQQGQIAQGGTIQVSGGIVNAQPQGAGVNHGAFGGQGYSSHQSYGMGGHSMVMVNEGEFCEIMNVMKRKCFDNDRMLIAKQALCNRMISVNQVIRMADLFTFESNKLEFAKFAYLLTCDKNQYYRVNDVFTFSSSIRNLECYIRSL